MNCANYSVFANEQEVIDNLKKSLEKLSNDAIAEKGSFFVGFSGGSLGKYLCNVIPQLKTQLDKWTIFFCDERYVQENNEDSTYGFYKKNLIPISTLKEEQFVTINPEDPLEKVANDYEITIREKFNMPAGIPEFDLLLLGMGPDGHTASLFPGHALLNETEKLVTFIKDSPKPPPCRITMTFPLINKAKEAIFCISGEGKADMIKRIFVDKENLPAGKVKAQKTNWYLDQGAALHLK